MSSDLKEICYKRNFLTEVIVRIDFISPLKDVESQLPSEITQAALKKFPIAEPRKGIAQKFQISPKAVESSKMEFTEWHFHGKEKDKTLTIIPTAVFIKYNAYRTYEQLRDEFIEILHVICEKYKEAQASRLGLRYINNININEPSPLEWSHWINSKLLFLFDFPDSCYRAFISRVFHNLEFSFDDLSLRYQFGMHNPDYPAPIKQKIFVMDFDGYIQGLFEHNRLPDLLDKLHTKIQEMFEMSITDSFRGKINE